MEIQQTDSDCKEDSVLFGCPPLLHSLSSDRNEPRMRSSVNRSKLHCDRESVSTDISLPFPICSGKEQATRRDVSSCGYSSNHNPPTRMQHSSDNDECNGPASKQARVSLCSRFSNLSLDRTDQSDSVGDGGSSDCETLKANSLKQKNALGSSVRKLLSYHPETVPFYVGRRMVSAEVCPPNTDQPAVAQSPVSFWNDSNMVCSDSDDVSSITPDMVTEQDQDGDTLLHYAVIHKNISLVKKIIHVIPQCSVLNILNNINQTPLHLAVITHQPQIVRLLLSRGACTETRDRNGNTALHLACRRGCLTCVQQLTIPLQQKEIDGAGYHVSFQRIPQDPGLLNYDGQSCLHLAANSGSKAVLDYLLSPSVGYNVNIKHGRSGRTILHEAVCDRNLNLLIHLLRNQTGFKLDINCEAFDDSTPLRIALCNGNKEAVLLLRMSGAME